MTAGDDDGSTPLDPDEAAGLIPSGIATRGDLDALEQANLTDAAEWALRRARADALTEAFVRELHRRMVSRVWRWAGRYRTSDKNLGLPWQRVPVAVQQLIDDARYQLKHATYGWDEFGVRFHHRLVCIHAFANGNGRHARPLTDVVFRAHGQRLFSWGEGQPNGARSRYLASLRAADERDFGPLLAFVRS